MRAPADEAALQHAQQGRKPRQQERPQMHHWLALLPEVQELVKQTLQRVQHQQQRWEKPQEDVQRGWPAHSHSAKVLILSHPTALRQQN